MNPLTIWSLLVLTLPTENATARMGFYRAIEAKGFGCSLALADVARCLPAGTRRRASNDDELLAQMSPVLDALYTHFAASATEQTGRHA
jgi:hypothetical protein